MPLMSPSRDIAPQFVAHNVKTTDGQVFNGRLFAPSSDGSVTLFTADDKAIYIPKNKIESDQLSTVSLMPEGLVEGMSIADFRNLLAYLLSRK